MDWNAAQYLKFEKERTQPAIDLAHRIGLSDPKKILDIGCGPGNSTHVLARRFPGASVLGADNSQDMLASARRNYPDYTFLFFDVTTDTDSVDHDFDIVFSNTCIQWIPHHPRLLRDMMGLLRPGGELAIQLPMNFQLEFYRIITEVSAGDRWSRRIPAMEIFFNLEQEEYFCLLSDMSTDFSMWETIYIHDFSSHREIMEWYRGAIMRPFLSLLPDAERLEFEEDVLAEVVRRYPVQRNGRILFRFPRLFLMASRP